jgi:hypothetical protein
VALVEGATPRQNFFFFSLGVRIGTALYIVKLAQACNQGEKFSYALKLTLMSDITNCGVLA